MALFSPRPPRIHFLSTNRYRTSLPHREPQSPAIRATYTTEGAEEHLNLHWVDYRGNRGPLNGRRDFDNYDEIMLGATTKLQYLTAHLKESLRMMLDLPTGMPVVSPGALAGGTFIRKGVSFLRFPPFCYEDRCAPRALWAT